MKKLTLLLSAFMALFTMGACSDDEGDYAYQVANVNAEAREGAIMLRWDMPVEEDFLFVKIEFYNIREKKDMVINRSIYSGSLLVDGLLARDGEYHFTLTAVNEAGVASNTTAEVSCTALPVQPVITRSETLREDVEIVDFSTNAQEPSEGPLENLFDGDNSTFFHTPWSTDPVPYPQWVQINLSDAVNGGQFVTINRDNGGGGRPDYVQILGSNDPDNWENAAVLYEFYGSTDIPNTAGGRYQSPVIGEPDATYQYFRYNVLSSMGGTYWNMAEMQWSFYDITEVVYDPENEVD